MGRRSWGDEVPMVIGCGPIGLAMILALKARGIGPVIASDFSAGRRALAEKMAPISWLIPPPDHRTRAGWM